MSTSSSFQPAIPIGTEGRFRGADYKVLGRMRKKAFEEGEEFYWDEYFLSSSERGAAWLQEDEGNWIFFKEMRKEPTFDPRKAIISSKFTSSNVTYEVTEVTSAVVSEVEGQFDFPVAAGDTMGIFSAKGVDGPFFCAAEWKDAEVEWLLGCKMTPLEVSLNLGGLELPKRDESAHAKWPRGKGDCKNYQGSSKRSNVLGMNLLQCTLLIGIIAALCALYLRKAYPPILSVNEKMHAGQYLSQDRQFGYLSQPFKIIQPSAIRVATSASMSNSWIFFTSEILDEKKEPVLQWGTNMSYYHGVEFGESWREGSWRRDFVYWIDKPGIYYLRCYGGEGGKGEHGKEPAREDVRVLVFTHFYSLTTIWIFLGLLFCSFIITGALEDASHL